MHSQSEAAVESIAKPARYRGSPAERPPGPVAGSPSPRQVLMPRTWLEYTAGVAIGPKRTHPRVPRIGARCAGERIRRIARSSTVPRSEMAHHLPLFIEQPVYDQLKDRVQTRASTWTTVEGAVRL